MAHHAPAIYGVASRSNGTIEVNYQSAGLLPRHRIGHYVIWAKDAATAGAIHRSVTGRKGRRR